MAKVELKDIVKRFGKVLAVDHVNLKIEDGEFFTLLGPSGCGKTTTLRIIAGLEFPDEGDVIIDDRVVTHLHPKDRDIAMVFQNYALYPHMTVFENIAFPLEARRKQHGLSKEEIRRRVVEVAKFLGIEDLLDRYPGQLSGGQQQRVALARALVRKPKVWLLDEPLSNLDAKLRVLMRGELKKLQKTLGITTIYVTHDQVEAMSMSDRVAVMNKGKVLQVGSPDDLYNKPMDIFVATFIGSPPMNIISCVFEELAKEIEYISPVELKGGILGEGEVFTRYQINCYDALKIPVAPSYASILLEKNVKEVFIGVRPEYMEIHKIPPQFELGVLKAKVDVVEALGSENILNILVGSDLVKVKTPGTLRVNPGEEIYVRIDLSKILVFDKKSGKLII
ncbi:MAG: ABC transporter ATP-binding protein [Desulfurococcaceae archaeon]